MVTSSRWQRLWACEGGVWPAADIVSLTSRPSLLGSSHPLVSRVSIVLHQLILHWVRRLTTEQLRMDTNHLIQHTTPTLFILLLLVKKFKPRPKIVSRPGILDKAIWNWLWTTRCDYCPTNFSTVVLRVIAIKYISDKLSHLQYVYEDAAGQFMFHCSSSNCL